MRSFLFFDNASTTRCCEAASQALQQFAIETYGNPSSSHELGQQAAKAIREARLFFANSFHIKPEQILFTGSGSEADNLAVYGVALAAKSRKVPSPRVLVSSIEHPAVKKTAQSLADFGIDVQLIPVDHNGQIILEKFLELLTPSTILVSIQRVNNIMGAILPVEELAALAKQKVPGVVFHTDAIQAFGKISVPIAPSAVDLVSISGHKVEGPKGVGALIVLNKALVTPGPNALRPLIWGGDHEGGFRSGSQNAGLIAGFHLGARQMLERQERQHAHVTELRSRLKEGITARALPLRWNSPDDATPHIVNLSFPGYPSGPFAKLLEERGCLVSTGSACHSQKVEPDAVLAALGLAREAQTSAIRISFSDSLQLKDVDALIQAMDESIRLIKQLLA